MPNGISLPHLVSSSVSRSQFEGFVRDRDLINTDHCIAIYVTEK